MPTQNLTKYVYYPDKGIKRQKSEEGEEVVIAVASCPSTGYSISLFLFQRLGKCLLLDNRRNQDTS